MFIATTENIAGYKVKETLGIVRGNSVRAKWVGADIAASFKNMVGGELTNYMNLMSEAREMAMQRMSEDAEELKADAIIGVRFMTSQIAQGAAEILVFGTAVKVSKGE